MSAASFAAASTAHGGHGDRALPEISFIDFKSPNLAAPASPLTIEGFQWVYEHVGPHIWLVSFSGGTDLCTGFVGGCPLLPVYAGEIQCRCLGAAVYAFDEDGRPVDDQVGELVITEPMPSMPLFFWNDPGGARYRESYFEMYDGVWRHGDWCKITPRGGVVIYGRSDATINRMGIRMGTSELYRVVEGIPEVLDSMVVDFEGLGGRPYMPLFVVLRPGVALDEALAQRIKGAIRTALSPRPIPHRIRVGRRAASATPGTGTAPTAGRRGRRRMRPRTNRRSEADDGDRVRLRFPVEKVHCPCGAVRNRF